MDSMTMITNFYLFFLILAFVYCAMFQLAVNYNWLTLISWLTLCCWKKERLKMKCIFVIVQNVFVFFCYCDFIHLEFLMKIKTL